MFLYESQISAECIAEKAYALSNDQGYLSPFALRAKKLYLGFEARGKTDDVTVIVA